MVSIEIGKACALAASVAAVLGRGTRDFSRAYQDHMSVRIAYLDEGDALRTVGVQVNGAGSRGAIDTRRDGQGNVEAVHEGHYTQ